MVQAETMGDFSMSSFLNPKTKIGLLSGDNEVDRSIIQIWADWSRAVGFERLFVASSKPAGQLVDAYEGLKVEAITSLDHLYPFRRGHKPLHRRIFLVPRLGGMAWVFETSDVDAIVLMDSDGRMLCGPEDVMKLLDGHEAYAQVLPFDRPDEAPEGWLCDLGMIVTRSAYEKLKALAEMPTDWVEALGDKVSIHGLLNSAFALCGVDLKIETMGGEYIIPKGVLPAYLSPGMDEDTWLNSLHVLLTRDGKPYFMHADTKRRYQLAGDVSTEQYQLWMAKLAAVRYKLPYTTDKLSPTAFNRISDAWLYEHAITMALLQGDGIAKPLEHFHHNWKAMQERRQATPPEVGDAEPVTRAVMRAVFRM